MHGMNNYLKQDKYNRGIALLITMLLISVLLGISASLLNITLKQFQFSSIGLSSEQAFQAANAGMECILNHDNNAATYPVSKFDVNGDGSGTTTESGILCMGGQSSTDLIAGNGSPTSLVNVHPGEVESGEEQRFRFTWSTGVGGAGSVCSDVSIYKFYKTDLPAQSMNTALGRTTGTNDCAQGVTCTIVRARGYNVACNQISNARTIERELTVRY